ncbi:BapA/Bap/LapF family prefix-like domain-containing protein [Acinetobacter pittii]|uniref:BapA/Bap/LapF family prefix-like domain-containing protein n=1 Tax=Acinetobacter pittii TaxID=48296 RepID=UPI00397661E3
MSEIRVVSKESHETLEITTKDTVSLSEASVILIKVNKDDVSEIRQDGRNAIITLKNGEQIVIVDFFNGSNYSTDNSLVFEDNKANSNMRCDSLKSLMIINKLSKFL